MTNETIRNIPESANGEIVKAVLPALPAEAAASGAGDKSRRDAMAVLAKHAAYTAPAVLTILSLSASRAKAGSF